MGFKTAGNMTINFNDGSTQTLSASKRNDLGHLHDPYRSIPRRRSYYDETPPLSHQVTTSYTDNSEPEVEKVAEVLPKPKWD